jgi:general secretion pathway protein F
MSSFHYKATTREGRVVEGVIDAASEGAVVASLRTQGYIPLKVSSGDGSDAGGGFSFSWASLSTMSVATLTGRGKVKSRDLMLFTRELATLLKAGLPLDRSLHSLSSLTENEGLKAIIGAVLARVREGRSLSEALAEHSSVFSPLFVNLVRAGEAGGMLEAVLERLADYLESNQAIRDQVRSAMMYPLILAVVASLAITILLVYVLPKFATLFDELGAAMPASTRLVMGASEFIQSYWWAIGGLLFVLSGVFARWRATDAGGYLWDAWTLRAPLFGELTVKLQISRFARTLGTMLKGGVPLIQALEIVRAVVGNRVISQALAVVSKEVSEGKGLSGPLENAGVFPALAIQMVSVGEETGQLDDMLLVVADHFDREVGNTVDRLMSLMGPLVLVVMGGLAGFIVMAMMSAVFSVNQMDF